MFSSFVNFGTVVSQRYGKKQLFAKSLSEQKVLERGKRRRLFWMWGGGGVAGANLNDSQKAWSSLLIVLRGRTERENAVAGRNSVSVPTC